MTRYILTPNALGNLTRIAPAWGSSNLFKGLTDDEIIDNVIARNIETGVISDPSQVWVVDEADLPGGGPGQPDGDYFFDCWEWNGACVVNMPKARVIHMDAIRVVRNAELAAKDIEFTRAVEAGDTDAQTTIGAAKQALRDLPTTFDLTTGITTPTQLKAQWPDILPARE
jgi:hypothetical protein